MAENELIAQDRGGATCANVARALMIARVKYKPRRRGGRVKPPRVICARRRRRVDRSQANARANKLLRVYLSGAARWAIIARDLDHIHARRRFGALSRARRDRRRVAARARARGRRRALTIARLVQIRDRYRAALARIDALRPDKPR